MNHLRNEDVVENSKSNLPALTSSDDDEEDDEQQYSRFGVGAKRSRYASSSSSSSSSSRSSLHSYEDAAATTAFTTIPSGFGGANVRRTKKKSSKRPRRDNSGGKEETENKPGAWEKHTRGIGSKILMKLGFTGRLGKNEDGIVTPLEPRVRPRGVGVGVDGSKPQVSKSKRRAKQEKSKTNEEEEIDDGDDDDDDEWLEKQRVLAKQRDVKVKKKEKSQQDTMTSDLSSELSGGGGGRIINEINMLATARKACVEKAKRKVENERVIAMSARDGAKRAQLAVSRAREKHDGCVQMRAITMEAINILKRVRMKNAKNHDNNNNNNNNADDEIDMIFKLMKLMNSKKELQQEQVDDVIVTVAQPIVKRNMNSILNNACEKGHGNRRRTQRILEVLKELRSMMMKDNGSEKYCKFITHMIIGPVRNIVDANDGNENTWDAVRGAAMADVLGTLKECIPTAGLFVMGEIVSQVLNKKKILPLVHRRMAVLPWIPVIGRRCLSDVLRDTRMELCNRMMTWKVSESGDDDGNGDNDELMNEVCAWMSILHGRSRILNTIVYHIVPRICEEISCSGRFYTSKEIKKSIKCWCDELIVMQMNHTKRMYHVVTTSLAKATLKGAGNQMLKRCHTWREATNVYVGVKSLFDGLSLTLQSEMKQVLGALLFIVHGKRVCDESTKWERIETWDGLLRNRFMMSTFQRKKNGEDEKGRLAI